MNDKLTIGMVLKPQGIKGEVKVKPLIDYPEELKNYKEVLIGGVEHKIINVRVAGGDVFYAVKGIADRDSAELLRGKLVEISRNQAQPLENGRFYIVDVIGCKVVTDSGREVGVVLDITTISSDIYTLKSEKGKIMFPFVKDLLISMDIKNKIMTVNEKRFNEVAVYED